MLNTNHSYLHIFTYLYITLHTLTFLYIYIDLHIFTKLYSSLRFFTNNYKISVDNPKKFCLVLIFR